MSTVPTAAGRGDTATLHDEVDRTIVAALLTDGRCTLRILADQTGLSVSATHARVRRLEASGLIKGYVAIIDPEDLGLPLAAILALSPLDPARLVPVPERLAELREVESCYCVAGEDYLVLLVRVASPRALEDLVSEVRRRTNCSVRTTVVLHAFFEHRPHTGFAR